MVRDLVRPTRPRVYVDVLILRRPSGKLITDKHAVQLLAVHVKHVRVPLYLWDASHLVQIAQLGD
jgi:hypothetical protein